MNRHQQSIKLTKWIIYPLLSLVAAYASLLYQRFEVVPRYLVDHEGVGEALVGGLPLHYVIDHDGISPVNNLMIDPLSLIMKMELFDWRNFFIDWLFWLIFILLINRLYCFIKQYLTKIKTN